MFLSLINFVLNILLRMSVISLQFSFKFVIPGIFH